LFVLPRRLACCGQSWYSVVCISAHGVCRAGKLPIAREGEAMQKGHFDETRATARLPNLDIEIIHGRSADGNAERLSISVLAVPSFEAFGRYLETANPFLFWMRVAQTVWAPWLGSAPVSLPPGSFARLPTTPESAGPNAERERGHPG
jgi:hypothetical protein